MAPSQMSSPSWMNWQGVSHPGEHGMSLCSHLRCLRKAHPAEVITWGTSWGKSLTWVTACLHSGSELRNQMASMGVVRGLLFKGHLLTYDPTYNVAEWVPMRRIVADLSPAEDSSVWELSMYTKHRMMSPGWNNSRNGA